MGKLDDPSPALIGAVNAPAAIINGYNAGNKNAISMADMMEALKRKQIENEVLNSNKLPLMLKPRIDLYKATPKYSVASPLTVNPPKSNSALGFDLGVGGGASVPQAPQQSAPSQSGDDDETEDGSDDSEDSDDSADNSAPAAPVAAAPQAAQRTPAGGAALTINPPITDLSDLLDDDKLKAALKAAPGQQFLTDSQYQQIDDTSDREADLQKQHDKLLGQLGALQQKLLIEKIKSAAKAGNAKSPTDAIDKQTIASYGRNYDKDLQNFQTKATMLGPDGAKQFAVSPDGAAMQARWQALHDSIQNPAMRKQFELMYPSFSGAVAQAQKAAPQVNPAQRAQSIPDGTVGYKNGKKMIYSSKAGGFIPQ